MNKVSQIMALLEINGFITDNNTVEFRTTSTTYYGGNNEKDISAAIKGVFVCIDTYVDGKWSSEQCDEYDRLLCLLEKHKSLCYDVINPNVRSIMVYIKNEWADYEINHKVVWDKLEKFWKREHEKRLTPSP